MVVCSSVLCYNCKQAAGVVCRTVRVVLLCDNGSTCSASSWSGNWLAAFALVCNRRTSFWGHTFCSSIYPARRVLNLTPFLQRWWQPGRLQFAATLLCLLLCCFSSPQLPHALHLCYLSFLLLFCFCHSSQGPLQGPSRWRQGRRLLRQQQQQGRPRQQRPARRWRRRPNGRPTAGRTTGPGTGTLSGCVPGRPRPTGTGPGAATGRRQRLWRAEGWRGGWQLGWQQQQQGQLWGSEGWRWPP